MPSYLRKDRVGRDSFLSQIGAIGDEYRTLFSLLCDMLEPELSYKKFISKMESRYPTIVDMIGILMSHLEKGRCGIISPPLQNGRSENARIILTNRDAPRFWYWYIENAWKAAQTSAQEPYPTVEAFRKLGNFPLDVCRPLPLAKISNDLMRENADEIILYAVQNSNKNPILATPPTLAAMVEVSREKIRGTISKSLNLQTKVSQLLGLIDSVFRQSISTKDHHFWYQLTKTLIDNREKLSAEKIIASKELFSAAGIIQAFSQNELTAAEEHRRDAEEKEKTMKTLLFTIAKKSDFLMTPGEFVQLFEPFDDKWPDLQTTFSERYMTAPGRTGLPPVVSVGSSYIYCDHLYLLFKSQRTMASAELKKHYVRKFIDVLKSRNRHEITVFSSLSSFRGNIKERIAREYPTLDSLIAAPRTVADGIIHYGTKVLKKADTQKLKNALERYFVAGTVRFKAPDELFDLHLSPIFEEAYTHLSLLRRLFMRISGRYESYVRLFDPLTRNEELDRKKPDSKKPRKEPPRKVQENKERKRAGANKNKSVRRETMNTPSRQKQNRGNVGSKKVYSSKQREAAWHEFEDLSKKKRRK